MKILSVIFMMIMFSNLVWAKRDKDGLTPLHLASGQGKLNLVRSLLKKGADIYALDSKMGISILHKGVYSGKSEIVAELIKGGALIDLQSPSNGNTPLHDALYFKPGKDMSVIKTLVSNGANLHLKNRAGLSPIQVAEVLKDEEAQRYLNEVLKNRFPQTQAKLMEATKANDLEAMRNLLTPGVNVDASDEQGFTPLAWASRQGFKEIVLLLLDAGADPNKVDQWMRANAGHKAAFWGRTEVLKLLIDRGLNIDAQGGYNGYTALHDAVIRGQVEVVRVLLSAGARVDIHGHDGKTALDLVKESNNPAINQTFSGWRIEEEAMFQLGFLNSDSRSTKGEVVPLLWPNSPSQVDGSVPLTVSLERGFVLPFEGDPKNLSYYMKNYLFPPGLDSEMSANKIIRAFHMEKLSGSEELKNFVKMKTNVFLKVGFILPTKDNVVLPQFKLPKKAPQSYLDSGLIYATLYLNPKVFNDASTESEKIEQSRSGLYSFKSELREYYSKKFQHYPEVNEDVFLDPSSKGLVSVYKIPKKILSFPNVLERPRKPGPENSYGSGLLLISRTDYLRPSSNSKKDIKLDEIESKWKKTKSLILEMGSLVQLN